VLAIYAITDVTYGSGPQHGPQLAFISKVSVPIQVAAFSESPRFRDPISACSSRKCVRLLENGLAGSERGGALNGHLFTQASTRVSTSNSVVQRHRRSFQKLP